MSKKILGYLVDKFMINEKVKNTNVTDIIKTPKKSIIPRSEKQKSMLEL